MFRLAAFLLVLCLTAAAQQPPPPRSDTDQKPSYSSSRDTKVEPEEPEAPPSDANPNDDVSELKRFNPHQAEKDVEVGSYYFKQKNYCGALNRFYSALWNQNNLAIAAFRLAETYEKLGDFASARKYYKEYLRIWAKGPLAEESQRRLTRLQEAPDGHLSSACVLAPPDAGENSAPVSSTAPPKK